MSAHTAATTIQTTINPHPPNTRRGIVLNTSLVVVIAPGKRPATFRTWKLSPAAPMVLQPTGCGRVGHRHNTLQASSQEPNGSWPLRFPTRKTPVNDRHTHKTTPNEHTARMLARSSAYGPALVSLGSHAHARMRGSARHCAGSRASQWLTRERGVELSRAPGLRVGGALPALGMGIDAGVVRLFSAGRPGTGGANMLRPVSLTVRVQRIPCWARIGDCCEPFQPIVGLVSYLIAAGVVLQ